MTILISPLNWGIGHATRLVPIIKILQKKHKIILAADGKSKTFLEQEFPELKVIFAPKFDVSYTKNASLLPFKMVFTLPKLVLFYFQNKNFVKKLTKKHKIDTIIADNRFGFFSKKIKSYFITHQIKIQAKNRLLENIIFIINKINIQKFNEVWIPDFEQNKSLSGKLSNCSKLKIECKKIGILSRFPVKNESKTKNENYDIVAIISGPEPQRTIFQKKITSALKDTDYKTLIISGTLNDNSKQTNSNLTIASHLKTANFQTIIQVAEIIISRAGYSSIMDLISLKQTAIIVPTPGQTEQEYLANYLHKNNIFFSVEQKNFNKNTISTFIKHRYLFCEKINPTNNNFDLENFLDQKFNEYSL